MFENHLLMLTINYSVFMQAYKLPTRWLLYTLCQFLAEGLQRLLKQIYSILINKYLQLRAINESSKKQLNNALNGYFCSVF